MAANSTGPSWPLTQGVLMLLVPIAPGEPVPFGPRSWKEIASSTIFMTALCSLLGYWLTRSTLLVRAISSLQLSLRDEAWEETLIESPEDPQTNMEEASDKAKRKMPRKRIAPELLFIALHNGVVSVLAVLAWMFGSPSLALHAFCLEVAYEIFDTCNLGLQRLEPETLVHHIVSPICILCSTQTDVDYRVLCHLCVCIDLSGAILGYSKFLLRYAHVSASDIYRRLTWVYGFLRVALPLVDTAIIVRQEVATHGAYLFIQDHNKPMITRKDWTQLYFWAMTVLDAFNIYFFIVIKSRARMPAHVVANFESRTGCR